MGLFIDKKGKIPLKSNKKRRLGTNNCILFCVLIWRRVRDSNPRAISLATRFRGELVMTTSITLRVFSKLQFSQFKNDLERTTGENRKKYSILMFWNPDESRVLCGRNRLSYGEFRVRPVMTTSILLQIWNCFICQPWQIWQTDI